MKKVPYFHVLFFQYCAPSPPRRKEYEAQDILFNVKNMAVSEIFRNFGTKMPPTPCVEQNASGIDHFSLRAKSQPRRLCQLQRNSGTDFTYIHGNLTTGIVLGCDKFDNENVNRTLSFLYKYNMLSKTNHIVESMRQSREIVFYGHSVNEMDFNYFKDFFKYVSKPLAPYPPRRLTFITKDEDSIRDIKDNMRNQGISLTDMYCNLELFDFILSSQIGIPNTESSKKWKKLLERIVDYNDKTK